MKPEILCKCGHTLDEHEITSEDHVRCLHKSERGRLCICREFMRMFPLSPTGLAFPGLAPGLPGTVVMLDEAREVTPDDWRKLLKLQQYRRLHDGNL